MFTRNRIYLLIAIGAVLLGLGVWWFFHLRAIKAPSRDALEAVPTGAFCLIESQDIRETWKKTGQGNLIWEELHAMEWAANATSIATRIDSLLENSPEHAALAKDRQAFLAFYMTGQQDFHYLFALTLPSSSDASTAQQFINKTIGENTTTKTEHGRATLFSGKVITFTIVDGILLISDQPELIKSGIDQLEKQNGWINDKTFQAVRKTAGVKSTGNIYLNPAQLLVPLRKLANADFGKSLEDLGGLSGWTELDATLRPNLWMFNGYSSTPDSGSYWLNCLHEQEPQRTELATVLPASTLAWWSSALSNFETFQENINTYSEQNGTPDRKAQLSKHQQESGFTPQTHFGEWMGNEFGYAITPGDGENKTNAYAVIAVANTSIARSRLESISVRDSAGHMESDSTHSIYRLSQTGILPITFGQVYARLTECVWTIDGAFVVFAESAGALQDFLSAGERGKTLATDRFYQDFASNLSGEANLSVYCSPEKSLDWWQQLSTEGFAKDLRTHNKLIRSFDGFALQFTETSNDLFYTSLVLRYNPQTKQEIASLWETTLDTTCSKRPQLVRNHKTNGLDIVVQDDAHALYLISSTGKISWKRKLSEPILSDIQQIDALKNEKLQLVFNTASAIYAIDRNGNDLEGFPIKLKAKATNALRVFDYDNNRDYRMLVACSDNKVYNYDGKGKIVEGWKFSGTTNNITTPIQHARVATKDYVVMVDNQGKIYITDRQGNTRLRLNQKLPPALQQISLEVGRDLSRTRLVASDPLGNVTRISFTDELERIHFTGFAGSPSFDYRDIDGDDNREYVFLDSTRLWVFGPDKKVVLSHTFEQACSGRPLVFAFGEKDVRVGVVCARANELHLMHQAGTETDGFPLFGNTPFSIGDLNNDGALALVAGGKGKSLFAYAVH